MDEQAIMGPAAVRPVRVVVVGAGPAGCVVSRRLSDAGHEVTLIEAGPGRPVPQAVTDLDWFRALDEPDWWWQNLLVARAEGQDKVRYLRGRGLGGCSAVNAMIALSGPSEDLSRFATNRAQHQVLTDSVNEPAVPGPLAVAFAREVPVTPVSLFMKDGRRHSAYDTYLAGREDQLEIRTGIEVSRLVVTSGRRVCGVELSTGEILDAERVVLCAGAIHSPVLLLRSEVANPHVGVGLQDHPAIPFTLKLRKHHPTGTPAATGMLTWSSGLGQRRDDLQVLILEHLGRQVDQQDGLDRGPEPESESGFAQVMVALMDVESRGSVTVDGNGQPVVQFNMLHTSSDRARLRHGLRRLVELLEDGVLDAEVSEIYADDSGGGLGSVPSKRSSLFDLDARDEELDEWMRAHLGDYVHAAGSCALDLAVGNGGVVRGWQGVSVIDASVMPQLPRANTQLPTLMLAESLVGQLQVLLNSHS